MNIEDATAKDFEAALLHIRDNGKGLDNIRNMLRAQCSKPGYRITATELAHACGWTNYEAANLHYGTFGKQVADYLNYVPPTRPNGIGATCGGWPWRKQMVSSAKMDTFSSSFVQRWRKRFKGFAVGSDSCNSR